MKLKCFFDWYFNQLNDLNNFDIENCLYSSKVPVINSIHDKNLSDVEKYVKDVILVKKIKSTQGYVWLLFVFWFSLRSWIKY